MGKSSHNLSSEDLPEPPIAKRILKPNLYADVGRLTALDAYFL